MRCTESSFWFELAADEGDKPPKGLVLFLFPLLAAKVFTGALKMALPLEPHAHPDIPEQMSTMPRATKG